MSDPNEAQTIINEGQVLSPYWSEAQTIIRSQVDHYLDTHLIEDLNIHTHLIEVTALGDNDKSFIPTGRVTVTIDLANRSIHPFKEKNT